jgi:hypothetical protein
LEESKGKLNVATEKYRIELQDQIDLLESEGFPEWTMSEYDRFIDANIEYPKDKYKEIATIVKNKTAKEVEEYSNAFY